MFKKILHIVLCLTACFCLSEVKAKTESTPIQEEINEEKVNLVLRQLGHALLSIHGDVTSRILPVSKIDDHEFMLELHHEFNYDTVPFLLDAALTDFEIQTDYYVSIKDCNTSEIILGYNQKAFENGRVPCIGREQWVQCNQIHFILEAQTKNRFNGLHFAFGILLGAIIFFVAYAYRRKSNNDQTKESDLTIQQKFNIGQITFDHQNQYIVIGQEQKSLTFRESKLLHFFFLHPNQVLKRDTLLSEVWGDEGVIVGRSLDVFISRLRKILSNAPSVQIKNVHGVGYRFEVKES